MIRTVAMRFGGLLRKESLQILRDPSSIAIAFVMPVFLLFIFGYGVSLDAKRVPLAIVVEQPNRDTQSFAGAFAQSQYFVPIHFRNVRQAEAAMKRRRVAGIVWTRANFSRELLAAGVAPIAVIVNGVDANNARIVEGYLQSVWANWLTSYARDRGAPITLPVQVEQRVWFNPAVRSRDYLVPGLIAVIMTLTGALLTAMVVAREWERGTMEALMVTPASIHEIMLSKLVPYFVLGMGGMALSVAMALWLFGVPLHGSLWVLMGASALFMLAALGMGLLVSTFARNQFVAGQVAIIVTFLPAFMLSGFIFDIRNMPAPIRTITYLVAARYFVAILQSVFLAGNVWSIFIPNAIALLLIAGFFLGLARMLARKRLD